MDTEEKENICCLISTIIIITLIIIGFFYFTKSFTAILAIACIFILPFIPFYYLYKNRQYKDNLEIEYEIQRRVEEYAEELKNIAIDIEDYSPEEYEEPAIEYLDSIKEEINSIAESLKDFYDSLDDRIVFYQETQENKIRYNDWYKKSKEKYEKMLKEHKKKKN